MKVYQIGQEVLDRDYHGAGPARAAIVDGKIVALSYDDDSPAKIADFDANCMTRYGYTCGQCSCCEFIAR